MTPAATLRRFALPALAILAALPVLASSGSETPEAAAVPILVEAPATRQILPREILARMRANLVARNEGAEFAPVPPRPMPEAMPEATGGE